MKHPQHRHPQHRHELRLNCEEKLFKCSGCKVFGWGQRYVCVENCNFALHQDCFKARPKDASRRHPLMGKCKFGFRWKPHVGPNHGFCDACGLDVQGFVYHDKDNHEHDLHPYCMNLKSSIADPNGRITLFLKDKMPSSCAVCHRNCVTVTSGRSFEGWSYVSPCGNLCCHVRCLNRFFVANLKVPSSSSSLREGSMFTDESGSSSRSKSVQSHKSISVSSSDVVERSSSRKSGASSFPRVLIEMAKVGFNVLVSVLFGNPTPLIADLVTKLMKCWIHSMKRTSNRKIKSVKNSV